jgi:hypothetical protein
LAQQLVEVIPLFEQVHPNCELLFCFDNSQNHHAKSQDALVSSRLNLSDGGANVPILRDTTYTSPLDPNVQIVQKMQTEDGIQKGIKTILTERGLFQQLLGRKVLECSDCKVGNPPQSIFCCARRCLSEQPDFKSQDELLHEVVEVNNGHKIIFFPKFHCELNFIEMVWGYLKRKLRQQCTFKFDDLKTLVPTILDTGIPTNVVAKASRHCLRFMSGYREKLHGPELDYAMKKYKGHRTIPHTELELIHEEFAEKTKLKIEKNIKNYYPSLTNKL